MVSRGPVIGGASLLGEHASCPGVVGDCEKNSYFSFVVGPDGPKGVQGWRLAALCEADHLKRLGGGL